jgi:HSP20 family molecular chaperone IbpA
MQQQDNVRNPSNEPQLLIRTNGLSNQARDLFNAVARRAYEIFESEGRPTGKDLENWLQAERELFDKSPLHLSESAEQVSLLADVHNYQPKELEIDLEPRRITIIGKHEQREHRTADGTNYSNSRKSGLLLSLQLPVEVDPLRANARWKQGMLELEVKKVPSGRSPKSHLAAGAQSGIKH